MSFAMPHGPSGFSPTNVENPVFGPPVPGRGIVLRPPVRVIYDSPLPQPVLVFRSILYVDWQMPTYPSSEDPAQSSEPVQPAERGQAPDVQHSQDKN
jgi:hypothetical protein